MLIMVAMGLMNIAWIGFLTVVIFVEKATRYGPTLGQVVGGIFLLLGIGVLVGPSLMTRLAL